MGIAPFEDIVSKLCSEFDLVDVAPKGMASQSSVSRWSKENDAQRAVQGISGLDFVFHTEREDNPWWELSFDRPYKPSILVLENRRKPMFQELARHIRIDVEYDGDVETVYSGGAKFGTFDEGVPLILPLYLDYPITRIRITLQTRGYLHLNSVTVLCGKDSVEGSASARTFISSRNDGFGERLKALMNTIYIAKKTGGHARFVWEVMPESMARDHSVISAEETFSPTYLENFRIKYKDFKNLKIKHLSQEARSIAADMPQSPGVDAILVGQGSLINQAPTLMRKFDLSMGQLSAFRSIEFSDELEKARRAAYDLEIPEKTIAVHLRAGDIVYGRYRFMDRYTSKVVPSPLAIDIVKNYERAGIGTLIFGQDEVLCKLLKDRFGARLASEIGDSFDFSETQKALFEITLMSRAQAIYAGSSGFAVSAARISNASLRDPYTVYAPDQAVEIIKRSLQGEFLDGVPTLQVAFASWAAIHLMGTTDPTDDGRYFLDIACRNDPANAFYKFVKAGWLYGDHADDEAESVLRETYDDLDGSPWSILKILSTVHPDGTTTPEKWMAPVEVAAERGLPVAMLTVSLAHKAMGKQGSAAEYRNRFLLEHMSDPLVDLLQ